jgi:hypothetical protein
MTLTSQPIIGPLGRGKSHPIGRANLDMSKVLKKALARFLSFLGVQRLFWVMVRSKVVAPCNGTRSGWLCIANRTYGKGCFSVVQEMNATGNYINGGP